MSGALDLSHPLQKLAGLLGAGSSTAAPSSTTSSNSSSAQPVTATTAQNTASGGSGGQANSSAGSTTSDSSTTASGAGVGGDPITTQAQPMDVTLQTPKDDTAQTQAVTPSKNTNYVVAVPSTGVRAPFQQTSQGWMVFGVAWYWWAILVIGIATAAVIVNKALAEREKRTDVKAKATKPELKQFISL